MEPEIKTTYYYSSGKRVNLLPEPNAFALRFGTDRQPLSPEAVQILRDRSEPILSIEHKKINVYRTGSRARALGILNREAAVEFATPVFRRDLEGKEFVLVTNQFLVQFKQNVDREQVNRINAKYDASIKEELDYARNAFLLEAKLGEGGLNAVRLANLYYESEPVEWAHPVMIKKQTTKASLALIASRITTDTSSRDKERSDEAYLAEQWHLNSQHSKVTDAWNIPGLKHGGGSPDITIAILDDGIDIGHPEFSGKIMWQWDFGSNEPDGTPKDSEDNHGTACAGVAVASGVKAYGAAPGCRLMAVRTPPFLGVDDEARMFADVVKRGADIISCSWGPQDNLGTVDPLPDNVRTAIRYCVENGRHGKGIPIFWAAGNGNELVSNDGYASNPDVMAVAACTDHETKSHYSDFGPEIWICAPSSGKKDRGEKAIFTIDRRGSLGYNPGSASQGDPAGDYTNDFGGTSSAAPLVAGIVALMLSENPDLTLSEVREILAYTADKIGTGYDTNGHSREFGYGRVNAVRAVQEAHLRTREATPSASSALQIHGPVSTFRGDPPSFEADPGAHSFFAIEVAIEWELFNSEHYAGQRNENNFFGSWSSLPLSSGATYVLPSIVWDRLKNATRLYYRLWASDSSTSWLNAETTIKDEKAQTAPFIQIIDQEVRFRRSISYPSGAEFQAMGFTQDDIDYEDPVANGQVPVIDVASRLTEKLSTNFTVGELAATDGARYARISPELVAGLQRLRARIGAPISINSGYRHPKLNGMVGGASKSRHIAGQAADVRCSIMSPLELARLALDEFGCNIGIGLGKNGIHIDVRGTLAIWVYEGAELSEPEFDAWVREICINHGP